MPNTTRAIFAMAAALAFALPLSAQTATFAESPERPVLVLRSTPASGVFAPTELRPASLPIPMAVRAPSRQNTALMVVGGAGLIIGAVIGGDEGTIVMLAGGGIGLLGLYRHLR